MRELQGHLFDAPGAFQGIKDIAEGPNRAVSILLRMGLEPVTIRSQVQRLNLLYHTPPYQKECIKANTH